MQKLNKKASILLWSIFLSLMISTIFISISVKINKSIRENEKIEEKLTNDNIIKNKIKNGAQNTINITDKEKLVIDKKNTKIWMKKNDKISINIDKSTNLNISRKKGVLLFSTGTNNYKAIENNISLELSTWSVLNLKNIWWYGDVFISSEKNINLPFTRYKVIERIWTNNVEKYSWEIK